MVAQLSFNFESLKVENTEKKAQKKRVRYLVPTYIKFYSLYQYDRNKFKILMKEWLNTPDGEKRTYKTLLKKQNEILEKCFIRDNKGKKLRDSDEPHIYRIRTLHKIYNEIYTYAGLFNMDRRGVKIDTDEKQAWLDIDDLGMSIKQRVIIHIYLLRLLRKGYSIGEAVCQIKLSLTSEI